MIAASRSTPPAPTGTRRRPTPWHAARALVALALGLGGCAGVPDGTPDGGGTASGPVHVVALDGRDERVSGVACTSPSSCVVTTDPSSGPGHVYAVSGSGIVRTLVTGDDTLAAKFGTLGTISFLGFSSAGGRLIARTRSAESAFISATGDPTLVTSWTATTLGTASSATFALNAQFALQSSGARSVLVSNGRIFETSDPPGASATWQNVWSPGALPPVPADIDAQRASDPTICNTDPTVSILPNLLQPVFVSPGLELVVAAAGSVNQSGSDSPGVCISTDGGHSFRHSAFASVPSDAGPVGVVCTSTERCVAIGGLRTIASSVYVFTTNNASAGAASTWTRATTPTLGDDVELRGVFFAPDATHGWIVGSATPASPLLLETVDGGATWTNVTSALRGRADGVRLHSGFALDATHIWVGGEHDLLLQIDR